MISVTDDLSGPISQASEHMPRRSVSEVTAHPSKLSTKRGVGANGTAMRGSARDFNSRSDTLRT